MAAGVGIAHGYFNTFQIWIRREFRNYDLSLITWNRPGGVSEIVHRAVNIIGSRVDQIIRCSKNSIRSRIDREWQEANRKTRKITSRGGVINGADICNLAVL